jgi:hypothetical protein
MHVLTTTACAVLVALPVAGPSASQRGGPARQSCTEIAESDVTILPHGFLLTTPDEFVPQHEVEPSRDERFWLCTTTAADYSLLVPLHTY